MLNRIAYAGGVMLLLAACTESPTAPPLADNDLLAFSVQGGQDKVQLQGGQDKVQVCHVDGKGRVRAIEVAAPALAAHLGALGHGDFLPGPGGLVPIDIPADADVTAEVPEWFVVWEPKDAFDGLLTTDWFAVGPGAATRSIQIDFGSENKQSFSSISAVVSQEYSAATTILVSLDGVNVVDPGSTIGNPFTWSGATADGDVLTYEFGLKTVQKVLITTTAPAEFLIGTGWYEIQFLAEGGAGGCT